MKSPYLTDALVRLEPRMEPFVERRPGFHLSITDPALGLPKNKIHHPEIGWEHLSGDEQPGFLLSRYGLHASVSLVLDEEHDVVTQSITLTNQSESPTPPINKLKTAFLATDVGLQHQPCTYTFGGGIWEGKYPPNAYSIQKFGYGRPTEYVPRQTSFVGQIIARREVRAEAAGNVASTSNYQPLTVTLWERGNLHLGLWVALEWSGMWSLYANIETEAWRLYLHGGPTVKDMVIEPGESIELPSAHFGVVAGSSHREAEAVAFNRIRRFVRDEIAPDIEGKRPWPFIGYHHWFCIGEDITETIFRKQVDRAAEIGIEFMELDSAWFPGSDVGFWEGIGNWERVTPDRFPNGLEPVAQYAQQKGLKFGLWFEPEHARKSTDWPEEHPEWFLATGSEEDPNLHLNLSIREAQDGLIELLSNWTSRLDIRWLRWDYNTRPTQFFDHADPSGKIQFAYYAGLHRVQRELLKRHPNLMIDNCASGGNRADWGMLRGSGTMVISDFAGDPHICRIMQTGGARILPANYMNSTIGFEEFDSDRMDDLELRSRMAGAISFSGWISSWSDPQVKLAKLHVAGYRRYRHLLMEDFYALTDYPRDDRDWDVVQFIDTASTESVILAFRVAGATTKLTVFPLGLESGKSYVLEDPFDQSVGSSGGGEHSVNLVSGQDLLNEGLAIELGSDSAAAFHLRPQ